MKTVSTVKINSQSVNRVNTSELLSSTQFELVGCQAEGI